jgi:hypothetical protein
MASTDSTSGTTRSNGEAAWAMSGVGGVRSSDNPVPDLWFGEPAEERRDTTCSAARKSNEGHGDGPLGYQRHKTVRELPIHAGAAALPLRKELGKPDAGKPPVRFDEGREAVGHWPAGLSIHRFPPTLHPYLPTSKSVKDKDLPDPSDTSINTTEA